MALPTKFQLRTIDEESNSLATPAAAAARAAAAAAAASAFVVVDVGGAAERPTLCHSVVPSSDAVRRAATPPSSQPSPSPSQPSLPGTN